MIRVDPISEVEQAVILANVRTELAFSKTQAPFLSGGDPMKLVQQGDALYELWIGERLLGRFESDVWRRQPDWLHASIRRNVHFYAAKEQKSGRKPSKMRNIRVKVDSIWFDSKKEADRWKELRLAEKAGQLTDLNRQVPYDLVIEGVKIRTPKGRVRRYVADFVYFDANGDLVIEDTKGKATQLYELKRDIMAAMGHHITEV